MKDVAPHDRPREKLERLGARGLGDNELLAVVIGSGSRDVDALALANRLIERAGGVHGLTRLGLRDRFDVVRCADDVARVKPDPALYLAVLEATGVPARQAVALEDSPNGVMAAKRAGLTCIAVPNLLTARLDLAAADLTLASLADVPLADLLARLGVR